jgi:hypothetical protein
MVSKKRKSYRSWEMQQEKRRRTEAHIHVIIQIIKKLMTVSVLNTTFRKQNRNEKTQLKQGKKHFMVFSYTVYRFLISMLKN